MLRGAFTLIELMVVIAIIGLLLQLILPGVQSSREAARHTSCSNNLRQIGIAVQSYHASRNQLPPSRVADAHATWLWEILPYLDQQALYQRWDYSQGDFYSLPEEVRIQSIPTYLCPTSVHNATSIERTTSIHLHYHDEGPYSGSIADYFGVRASTCKGDRKDDNPAELDGAIVPAIILSLPPGSKPTSQPYQITSWRSRIAYKDVTDGLSQTLLCGEASPSVVEKTHAFSGDYNNGLPIGELRGIVAKPFREDGFFSFHPGICHFCMLDGSVQSLSNDIDPKVLDRMATRAGNDIYDIHSTAESCLP